MIKILALILLSELWTTAGQIFFKKSTNQLEPSRLGNLKAYFVFAQKILRMPEIWFGLILMAVGLVIWLAALSRSDLSTAFPIASIQYVFVLIASRIFLKEPLDRMKITGTLLVVAGIITISFS